MICARLVTIQAFSDPDQFVQYSKAGVNSVAIPAVRGTITDRNGVLLAVTVDSRNVFADQTLVTDPKGEAIKLANLLGLDAAYLAERLSGDRRFVYLAKDISPQLWSRIEELALPGIYSERSQARSYPEGSLAGNILGFVNADGVGSGGIELSLNEVLAGTDGERIYSGGSSSNTSDQKIIAAVDGQNVQLTIDRDIQWLAQEAIAAKVKESGAESGTVIVLNSKTGEILAMATAPTFDPNNYSKALERNRGNRALTDAYEPGSTGKIMTIAAVLEEGVLQANSKITVPGSLQRYDKKFKDHNDHGTLKLTLTGVLAKSSNIGTILASEQISQKKLFKYFSSFGIGSESGLNFPGESNGFIPQPSDWSGTTGPTLAFGQGYSMNALQAAGIFATVANDGMRMTPNLVSGTTAVDGTYTSVTQAQGSRVVSAQTATTLRKMLESVVSDEGTAPMARIPGYRIAGKTGTAQLSDPSCGCYRGYVASFVGMAPADNPELVVAVSLVKPTKGHYGGILAGPVFKKVMNFALQQLRIPPTGAKSPKMKLTW
jgi:cell division protein FtsI (penicillin-binding protein 3)